MWLIDLVILVTVLEGAGLTLWHRRSGRGLPPRALLPNLGAGLCLLIAVRVALGGGGIGALSACLTGAGIAHALDLSRRWRQKNII